MPYWIRLISSCFFKCSANIFNFHGLFYVTCHAYHFHILLLASIVGGDHLCVFECVGYCLGSFNDGLLFLSFMLE